MTPIGSMNVVGLFSLVDQLIEVVAQVIFLLTEKKLFGIEEYFFQEKEFRISKI